MVMNDVSNRLVNIRPSISIRGAHSDSKNHWIIIESEPLVIERFANRYEVYDSTLLQPIAFVTKHVIDLIGNLEEEMKLLIVLIVVGARIRRCKIGWYVRI